MLNSVNYFQHVSHGAKSVQSPDRFVTAFIIRNITGST